MTRYLHGGGVPLVCDLTVADIAGNPKLRQLPFSGRSSEPMGDGLREVTLKAEVVRTETPGSGGRPQYAARFADDETLRVLRRDAAAPQHAVRTGPEAPAEVKFYYRIVDRTCGGQSEVSTETLRALAAAMKADRRPQTPSTIPAAYTYLGQFIAHDMTWMDARADGRDAINLRSHALDLDSLFGAIPPEGRVTEEVKSADGLCIGQTSAGRYEDLPRSATGFPCIPDPRNDNNLAVAQLTVAMMKFHRRVCELTKGCSSEEQRTITRRHVQSVVLHDYLPRIIDPDVYCDVMHRGGRKVIFPSDKCGGSQPELFQVPIEFAAACFRFGHTMVRNTYNWNAEFPNAKAGKIRRFSHLGVIQVDMPRLVDNWVIDWSLMHPHTGLNSAAAIQPRMNSDLLTLGPAWVDPNSGLDPSDRHQPSLAEITLLRGHSLGLVSGQTLGAVLADCIGDGAGQSSQLIPDRLLEDLERVEAPGLGPKVLALLRKDTPLWLYVLEEARLVGKEGRLGPLASRVVMEVIHASIEADNGGILSLPDSRKMPVLEGLCERGTATFSLGDLIRASHQTETIQQE